MDARVNSNDPRPHKSDLRPLGLLFSCLFLCFCLFAITCAGGILTLGTLETNSNSDWTTGALIRAAELLDFSTPMPREPGTVYLPATRGDPPTLDPALATDTASAEVIVEIFSGLVTIGPDQKIHPDVAQSWSVSEDGMTYTFTLRPDVRFSDGRPITAQDFKYSIERAADPRVGSVDSLTHIGDIVGVSEKLKGQAEDVRGVRVIDEHTLQITIDAPKAYFLARLATPGAFIVEHENVEKGGSTWFLHPVGSGPYKLVRYVRGDQIVLERNELYTGSPKPTVRRIVLALSPFPTSFTRYSRGELDSALVNMWELDAVQDPKSPYYRELTMEPSYRLEYIGFNVHAPPFDDVKVRQAFALAIDKEIIARDTLRQTAVPAAGYFAPGFPGYDPDLKGWEYNPAKARQLISESKYGNVASLPDITLDTPGSSAVAQAVLGMIWRNLGISIRVREQPFASFLEQLYTRPCPFQMYSLGRSPEYPDPVYLDIPFHSQNEDNAMGYSNGEVDRLLELARSEKDEGKRIVLYQQAERLILDDLPWIPLFFSKNYWLTKPNVKGLIYPPFVMPRLKYITAP